MEMQNEELNPNLEIRNPKQIRNSNERKFKRKQIRLVDYDYSSEGKYFITINIKDKNDIFTKEVYVKSIVEIQWQRLSIDFPNISLDEFIIMPDHVHGIITIIEQRRGLIHQTRNDRPWQMMADPSVTLGKIVRHFKAKCTKLIRDAGIKGFTWQRGFYDHIIRNEQDLRKIRKYIKGNPHNDKGK